MRKMILAILAVVITGPQPLALAQQKDDYPPVQTVRIWSAITPAAVITRVQPTWPRVDGKVMGVVLADVWIDKSGRVRSAKITRSIPIIDAAVIAAVRQWTFSPATVGDEPVAVVQQVDVRYPPLNSN